MRIGCLQFSPQVGDTENNLNRADAVLSKANPDDLDLLVLPELAFSGYNFTSLQHIMPFLEPSGSGITSLWARTMALKYNCTVSVGYPEKVDVSSNWPTGPEYYNSTFVVNGDGETVANYRKQFLYYTDESWALEGDSGFYEGFIPGLGNTSIGICMDLNPYKFEAPWHNFEFAFHVLEVESNLVILSMAWMTREDRRKFTRMPNEPDMETLTYWVTRLEPLIRADLEDEIIVVFCNRTGVEDDATYAGTSAVIGILDGEVKVYGLLGRGEKELLVVDTSEAPYAKLLHRPSTRGAPIHPGNPPCFGDTILSCEKSNESCPIPQHDNRPSPESIASKDPVPAPSPGQKKRAAPIMVPSVKTMPSARSPTSDLNIPTPSAPSPTPMAIRPRLIIPESPPILPQQYSANCPVSASSLHSMQSYKSEDSEASTQTIRSNPRPPEDSTPYPHSSAPLSGYPDNNWEAEKRIYGGNVTISQYGNLSPTTPFEDISPTAVRHFWRPPEYSTPVGRKPEPFPWSEITGKTGVNTNQGSLAQDEKRQPIRQEAVTNPLGSIRSPQSSTSSSSSNGNKSAARSVSRSDRSQTSSAADKRPVVSPLSRSRNGGRPYVDEQPGLAAKANDTEPVSTMATRMTRNPPRANSATSMRENTAPTSVQSAHVVDRPPSPKSRNCSRNRPHQPADSSAGPHMIPIVASPSIFRSDARTPETKGTHRSSPRASSRQHIRTTSLSGTANISRSVPPTDPTASTIPRTTSRTASRGRQRGQKDDEASASDRTSSRDSIVNDKLHTRVSRRESRESRRPSRSGRRSSQSSSQQTTLSHYQRIEVVSCSQCPVHGQPSDSSTGERGETELESGVEERSKPVTCNTALEVTSPGASLDKTPTQCRQPDVFPKPATGSIATTGKVSRAPGIDTESNGCGSSGETARTSSSGRSSATPSSFDPTTPKAMAFSPDKRYPHSNASSDTDVKGLDISADVC